MKKTLLASAAIAGLVLASAPAQAQMELTIGGHSKNYIGYVDQDEAPGTGVQEFDMQRETELHFNGESTLDNGLTFGFQVEAEVDAGDDANTIEESYIYMSGTWGRVNLGSEDGASYLLQVAAPSADSNIDGIRQYINPVNVLAAVGNLAAAGLTDVNGDGNIDAGDVQTVGAFGQPSGATNVDGFDYDNDLTGVAEKITYLSPNFNGFQLGASFTPLLNGFNTNTAGNGTDEAYEIAARYEGVMSNFGYALGGGYTDADGITQWNGGLDIDVGAFGVGFVYTETDTDAVTNSDIETMVVGVDYTTGPFKFGASYLKDENETANADFGADLDTDRYTAGVVYTAGPGLSFRGSVSQIEHEIGATEIDATSVLGGVQINF